MAGIGVALKGIGRAYKKFKTRHGPKPGPENKFKYQGRDPTGESKFDYVDRMDAKAAWEAGEKPPFKVGKMAKRIIQTAVGAPIAIIGASKVKKKLKKKDKD
jgi:hypothetical protein